MKASEAEPKIWWYISFKKMPLSQMKTYLMPFGE